MEKVNTLKIQSDNMETETHRGYCTTEPETTNRGKKVAWFTFWDNDFADKVELDLSNRVLIQEDGKWFVVKKKKEYPKTYEECCDVLNYKSDFYDADNYLIYGYMCDKLRSFQKLLVCRDAYWKIAGEEMGLDKLWEPVYSDFKDETYGLYNELKYTIMNPALFVFPTAEMRDAFYEAFKKEIETCKKLL